MGCYLTAPLLASTETKTFEGRVLDRQHEDVEEQGLAFDLGTLLDRRRRLLLRPMRLRCLMRWLGPPPR